MTLHRARVQSRKGPIEVVIQVLDDDLPAGADHEGTQDFERQSDSDLDFSPAASGSRIGKYLLGPRIGEGTFGIVYQAHDTVLDRDVAVKVLKPEVVDNAAIRARFIEEGKAAARVCHPAIVTVFDAGVANGQAYIAMEMLKGESLHARLLRMGRLSPEHAMELSRQMASALDAAHQIGVIHRDLKPENVMIVTDPTTATGERVKIFDFGLAKQDTGGERTAAKLVFGTPRYMSPEQTRSAALVDARSDIYALGCILFELLCGVPPFDGDVLEVVRMHQQTRAPRVRAIVPTISAELERLVSEMMAKNPNQRPQTMGAVQRALAAGGAFVPNVATTMAPTVMPAVAQPVMPLPPAPPRIAKGTTPQPSAYFDFELEEMGSTDVQTQRFEFADAEVLTGNENAPVAASEASVIPEAVVEHHTDRIKRPSSRIARFFSKFRGQPMTKA